MTVSWETVVDWFVEPTAITVAISLALFAMTLGVLEHFFHVPERERIGPRSRWLDLIFWFFTPLVTKFITSSVLLYLLGVVAGWWGAPHTESIPQQNSLISRQPLWLQVIGVLLLGDFIHYWTHRLFHGDRFWPAHAVHHSPTELDWFSSMRMHPINDIMTRAAQGLPLVLLGFSLQAVFLAAPIISLVVIISHTNVPWTFGPLRYVVVSPVYHQWHHSSEPEAIDKNFAGMFPIWDLMFGTYYMPRGKLARRFGCKSDPPPEHLPGQMVYPLRVWFSRAFGRTPVPPLPAATGGSKC